MRHFWHRSDDVAYQLWFGITRKIRTIHMILTYTYQFKAEASRARGPTRKMFR